MAYSPTMIVRPREHGLHLITQPDHAALARRMMEQWKPLRFASRRESILLAIGGHDDGWQAVDEVPVLDSANGAIADYVTLPLADRQAVWPRGIELLAQRDRWAAALVALHGLVAYQRYRGDAAWDGFFGDLETRCSTLTEAAGGHREDLEVDYPFLRIGDLASLAFCTGAAAPPAFQQWTFRLEGDHVSIAPDGFGGRELPFSIAAREMPSGPFSSADELKEAFERGRPVVLSGTISGAAH
jgi:hypothetical protein